MTDDLVKRLREPLFGTVKSQCDLMAEAANQIEQLEAALHRIANLYGTCGQERVESHKDDKGIAARFCSVMANEIARAALGERQDG